MMPNHLLCKDDRGQIIPFELDGVQYVDGSLQVRTHGLACGVWPVEPSETA